MQIEHKTEKGTLCFLLPQNGTDINYTGTILKYMKEGFQLIGLTSEVAEEEAKMMLPEYKNSYHEIGYPYYNLDGSVNDEINVAFVTALKSFKSLMQHLEVYEVNPYGETQPYSSIFSKETDQSEINQRNWNEAQSRTGKWIVLFKK